MRCLHVYRRSVGGFALWFLGGMERNLAFSSGIVCFNSLFSVSKNNMEQVISHNLANSTAQAKSNSKNAHHVEVASVSKPPRGLHDEEHA